MTIGHFSCWYKSCCNQSKSTLCTTQCHCFEHFFVPTIGCFKSFVMRAFILALLVALLAQVQSTPTLQPSFKRQQALVFVIDNLGNSSTDSALEANSCATIFLEKIKNGQLTLGGAMTTDMEEAMTQAHHLTISTMSQGSKCTMSWSLTSHPTDTLSMLRLKRSPAPLLGGLLGGGGGGVEEEEESGARKKRSPGLGEILQPTIDGLSGTLAAVGRRRRGIIEEIMRKKRSPAPLERLLGGLLGGGGGGAA